jgi:hypothetical protein
VLTSITLIIKYLRLDYPIEKKNELVRSIREKILESEKIQKLAPLLNTRIV